MMQLRSLCDRLSAFRFLVLMLLLAVFAGCQEMVPARFTLPERPTLVLVDDPQTSLGDRMLPGYIAAEVSARLTENKLAPMVTLEKLAEVRQNMGAEFDTASVERIGKAAGAEQVIHVHVMEVNINSEPGTVKPRAAYVVKVLDLKNQKRLFPAPPEPEKPAEPAPDTKKSADSKKPEKGAKADKDSKAEQGAAQGLKPGDPAVPGQDEPKPKEAPQPLRPLDPVQPVGPFMGGEPVVTEMPILTVGDDPTTMIPVLRRRIAERIGRDVAFLFYLHAPDEK